MVDHRLLSESGRAQIIQEQKDVVRQLGDLVEGTKDTTNAVRKGLGLIKQYEEATQNMTPDEKWH